jgi:HK97 family phage major capsid protein
MSIQALRERITALNNEANALLASNGDRVWSKDDQAKYDGILDEAERGTSQLKALQARMDADADRAISDARQSSRKSGTGDIDAVQAVALFLRHGNNVTAEQAVAIRNAMSTTTGSEGGFTVPTEVSTMVIDALKAFGGLREEVQVISTSTGADINFPSSDGTSEVGEIVGQNAAATTGEITFGSVPHVVYKFSSKKLALPWELIQDSGIDVVQFVVNRLAQRIGRIQNQMFTVGTGSSQPFGIVTRATSGKVGATGQTANVTYDDLVDLEHSVNRAYRNGACWMLADSSVKVVRKIKDSQGRPIFVPGYEVAVPGGAPDTLLGRPICVNDDVPAMAANAKSILFGNFKNYLLRDVVGLDIRRFDDSAFALNGQVGFCGWQRSGGNLLDTAAVKFYQNSAS